MDEMHQAKSRRDTLEVEMKMGSYDATLFLKSSDYVIPGQHGFRLLDSEPVSISMFTPRPLRCFGVDEKNCRGR